MRAMENMASLRALPSSRYLAVPDVELRGYYTPGDEGRGIFCWNAADTQPDNGGTVIKPDDVPADCPGRLIRVFSGPVHALWFGVTVTPVAEKAAPERIEPFLASNDSLSEGERECASQEAGFWCP